MTRVAELDGHKIVVSSESHEDVQSTVSQIAKALGWNEKEAHKIGEDVEVIDKGNRKVNEVF